MKGRLFHLLLLPLLVFCLFQRAEGAVVMVRPMIVDVAVTPGSSIRIPIEIRNNSNEPNSAVTMDLHLLDLVQNEDGDWVPVTPENGHSAPSEISAKQWMKLENTGITIRQMEIGQIGIGAKIPYAARGFYFAALLIQEKMKTDQYLRMAFLVPIILEISGRPVRQKVALKDVDMVFQEPAPDRKATTIVGMEVLNEGRTFSRLKGKIRVFASVKERWLLVTEAEVRSMNIMPTMKLNLKADLERRLPSGKFKLVGEMSVDGYRLKPLEKIIDFQGDTQLSAIAIDSALILNPPELVITSLPGAYRTSVITLENASEELIEVETYTEIPKVLSGVAIGEIRGDELSCAEWIRISPSRFRIRSGGKQNVRVVSGIPKDNANYPNYYGYLNIKSQYPNGQSAGETNSLVLLRNKDVENRYQVKNINLALAETAADKYLLKTRWANIGNTHLYPGCRCSLQTGVGDIVTEIELIGETGIMLPMAIRDFSGEIDLTDIEPGVYRLIIVFDLGEGNVHKEVSSINVSLENGQKTAGITDYDQNESKPGKHSNN